MTITLPPATEARLRERAAATGQQPHQIVMEAVEARLAEPLSERPLAEYEQWHASLHAWLRRRPQAADVADDTRESIYSGRDE